MSTVSLPFPVFAAKARSKAIHSATVESAEQDDIFVPTSAWLVGPSTLAPSASPTPCVMANQYNNGFLFRFSGGGRKLYAMAVDFRQPVFKPGQLYTVVLGAGKGYKKTVKAEAFDAATLLINLQAEPGLYKAVGDGGTLEIGIGSKTFDFALLGAGDGLKRLEKCYNPAAPDAAPMQSGEADQADAPDQGSQEQASAAPTAPVMPIARDSDGVDPAYRKAVTDTSVPPNTTMEAETPETTAIEPSSGGAAASSPVDDQAASLGMHSLQRPVTADVAASAVPEKLEAANVDAPAAGPNGLVDRMLKKAAAGINRLAPSASSGAMGIESAITPQPPKIARVGGQGGVVGGMAGTVSAADQAGDDPAPQYEAVTQKAEPAPPKPEAPSQVTSGALAGNWTSAAVRNNHERDILAGANRSMPILQDAMPGASTAAPAPPQFRAMNGSNLQDILTIWAQNENVRLVWDAKKQYDVKQTVDQKGNFDTAVQSVLNQYDNDPTRPVAQLYNDPASGQKTLLIRQSQAAP